MPNGTANNAARRAIQQTLSPQRLAVLGWAFAAIFFGSGGLSAYFYAKKIQYSGQSEFAGVPLPPQGPVTSTGSIGMNGQDIPYALMPTARGSTVTADNQINQGQIETLQKEVIALRRRLMALSEQNRGYSNRIATLEERLQDELKDGPDRSTASVHPDLPTTSAKDAKTKAAPPPQTTASRKIPLAGTPTSSASIKAKSISKSAAKQPPIPHAKQGEMASSDTGKHTTKLVPDASFSATPPTPRERIEAVPAPEVSNKPFLSMSELYSKKQQEADPAKTYPPVRIVALPSAENSDDPSMATGSINPTMTPAPGAAPEIPSLVESSRPGTDRDEPRAQATQGQSTQGQGKQEAAKLSAQAKAKPIPAPSGTTVTSLLIAPSAPAGRTSGSSIAKVSRSDFGAVIGSYENEDEANEAWLTFMRSNGDRLRDVHGRLNASVLNPGQQDLIVGPFPNAAEVAVACLKLLDITEKCHPVLFSGARLEDPTDRELAQNPTN